MTASLTHSRHRYTYDQYLAFERDSEMKHEFADGEIYAMAGSLRHSALASRISAALESARPSDCIAPSTEEADRGSKLEDYQRIHSLQEYVLVSQYPRIEIYRRLSSGSWKYRDVREGVVTLASGATLDLSILYAGLPH